MIRVLPSSVSINFPATTGVVVAGHRGGFVREVEGKLQLAGGELNRPEVTGLPGKPSSSSFPASSRFYANSSENPASHRWGKEGTWSAGAGLLTGGQSLAGKGLRRENRSEREWKVERETASLERERFECYEFLLVPAIFEGLLELVWKFRDIRSIRKIRINHLELLVKFLSFVLPLNRQLKVSPTKSSTLSLCTVTPMFMVLIPFFIRNFTYSLVQ